MKLGLQVRRQGEIDDAGGPEQLERRGDELPDHDGRPRIFELELADVERRKMQDRARRRRAATKPSRTSPTTRAVVGLVRAAGSEPSSRWSSVGSSVSTTPAEQDGAEPEGEGAQGDEDGDLRGRSGPCDVVGPVAHERAGEDRGADVVRQRVGRERASPRRRARRCGGRRDAGARCGRTRRAPHRRRGSTGPRRRSADRGNRLQALPDVIEGEAAKFAIEKPTGDDDRQQPDARAT